LELDETLTQAEVEYRFGTNFGYQFKGITYRSPDTGRYVILLANEGAVYDDSLGRGRTFTYVGEGVPEKGDQIETVANRALLDAVNETFPIYLFTSTDGEDRYHYRGLVEVVDVAAGWRRRRGRLTPTGSHGSRHCRAASRRWKPTESQR
jgi:putative restriction endonuclease